MRKSLRANREMTRLFEERKRIPAISLAVFHLKCYSLTGFSVDDSMRRMRRKRPVNFMNFILFTNYHQNKRKSITWKIRKKRKFNRVMKADLPIAPPSASSFTGPPLSFPRRRFTVAISAYYALVPPHRFYLLGLGDDHCSRNSAMRS